MMYEQANITFESERPRTVSASRVLIPNLVVLLGSTSALAALELMRQMLTLKPRDQRKVALVYIDTDDPPAPLIEFRKKYNNVFLEHEIRIKVPVGISNAQHVDESDQHTFIHGKVPQYYANGAGGIRNNGHVAACFAYQHIYNGLDKALTEISQLTQDQDASTVHEVQANIVAFLGGGTGSGILSDIAVMVRDHLAHRQYKQRINCFCILPQPVNGITPGRLKWQKSNTTACLLEVLAYSRVAAADPVKGYEKYMRGKVHRLTNEPIANEIYLIGDAQMTNASDTARIVGLDLFQRTINASGVGELEHSAGIDRHTLASTDERGLPNIFSTSCPLEIRFPAEETALAFAQISAASLLPLLAGHQPRPIQVSDGEKREWLREWRNVARFDASMSDPRAVQVHQFRSSDFEEASLGHLDILWARLERFERETEERIHSIIDQKRQEEEALIKGIPQQSATQGAVNSLINQRIQHLFYLKEEYAFVLSDLKERPAPRVPRRPSELEDKLVRQPRLPGFLGRMVPDHSGAVAEEYNMRLNNHARATRMRLIEKLLTDLSQQVQEAIKQSLSWFQSAGAEMRSRELDMKGRGSMAWKGKLDYAHAHQQHIFDLDTLRTLNQRNIAVERLYFWATGGDQALIAGTFSDFNKFVEPCVDYLLRHMTTPANYPHSIDRHIASRLADRVVDYFYKYYMGQFENINLFELLDKAAPEPRSGQSRIEQIKEYLALHLLHMRKKIRSLVAFEAELWQDGSSVLDISLYLGMHWRDGSGQQELFSEILNSLGALSQSGLAPKVNTLLDPHRLQISYAEHAFSLSVVRDFYLSQNSAMEYYNFYQDAWEKSGHVGTPVHSSGQAEQLVRANPSSNGKTILGYPQSMVNLVIRQHFNPYNANHARGNSVSPHGGGSSSVHWGDDL